MEYEVRFYLEKEKINKIIKILEKEKNLNKGLRTYEKTIQYNHPNKEYNFYSKEIDGRFRIRVSKNEENNKCMISWKKRISNDDVNIEEEKEVTIKYKELDNLLFIVNNVLHLELVESYERYRTVYTNDDIEISIDEYPFGIALEIENKSKEKDPIEVVKKYTKLLDLNIDDSYKLSWDDKYSELCKEQNIKIYNEVTFDKEMPNI